MRILLLVSALSILTSLDGWLTIKNKYANRKIANTGYVACTYTWPNKMFVCVVLLSQIALRLVGEGKGPITFYNSLFYPYDYTWKENVLSVPMVI